MNYNAKILVADDESRMRRLIKDFLRREGYRVTEAADGEEALDLFYETKEWDLVILDIMMPRRDGYDVLAEIRETSDVPVIMLTAKSAEEDELKGYDLGVDEYITKPFSPKILTAHVGAILKRSKTGNGDGPLVSGGITLDTAAHEVRVEDKPVTLSVKEFELLTYFMKNPGVALSRDHILNAVWDYDFYGDERTIDTHVKTLRNKLGEKGKHIKTIWGMGYKFEPDESK